MKRILSLILVLLLAFTTMVGCDMLPFLSGDNGDGGDVTYDVTAAKEFITQMYKDVNSETKRNYDVAAQCRIDGVTYEISWVIEGTDKVTVQASANEGFWTIVVPDKTDAAINYKIVGTIKAGDGTTATVSFDRVVPVVNTEGITSTPVEGVAYKLYMVQVNLGQKLYATSTDEQDHKYIQTTNDPTKAADYYVEKVDGGYKWYTTINGVKNYVYAQGVENNGKISKYIGFSTENSTVFNYVAETNSWQTTINGTKYCVGTYNTYKTICISEATYINKDNTGVSQFVVEFITSSYANTLTPDAEPETITDSAKVVDKVYTLADGEVAGGTFIITGVITELDSYGNPTIVVTGKEDKPVLCYKLTDDRFVVGATITVTSKMLKNYQGKYELMDCTLNNIVLPGSESTTPTVAVVDVPEVGVAYKLGLFHGNEAADVFFNGQNYNSYAWYLAYAGAADAIDVYLEAVEGVAGSYRLYFMNGETKTYIVLFPRDGDTTKGTLKLDTAVPTECYTYSTEYKTLIYTSVTGEQFYMGSSGTYKSISTSAISYITESTSYVSHFYTVTGVQSGNNGNTGNSGNTGNNGSSNYDGGVQLTVDTLALPSQNYNADKASSTVDGVTFEYIQLGNYGNGIQMRDKDGKTTTLWNATAFEKGIKEIVLVYSSTQEVKYANADAVIFTFGNAAGEATYTTKLSTTAGVKTYTITPDADTYTFFKLEHDLGYTFYWDSITIVFAD